MRNIFKKLISDFIFPCLVAIIALLFIPDIADGQVNWPGRQLVDKSSIHGQTTKKQSRIRFEERGDVIVAINSHGETIGTYPADHSRAGEKWQNTTSMAKFFTLQDAVNAANDGETLLQILNSFGEGLTTINKKVTIDGDGRIFTSSSSSWGVYVNSENVTFVDFKLFDAGTYGIITSCDADNLHITNTEVGNCDGSGFAINSCDNAVLTNVNSHDNIGLGLSITDCNNMTINGLTTTGNAFSGGFSAGVGFFSGGACAPPAGISNITFSGTISIAEPIKAYEQILGGGTITGITYPPALTYYAGGGGTPPNIVAKYYVTSKADAYTLAATLLAPPTSAPVGTVFVGEEATDNYYVNDLLAPAPPAMGTYTLSIQAAINYLPTGNTIFIENGTYEEASIVNKSLTIDGEGSTCGGVVIEGGGIRQYGFRIPAGVEDVTIQDVTIQNTVGTGGGIDAYYDNDGLVLQRLCLINTSGLGAIKLQGPVDNVTIDDCKVSGLGVNGRGIVIWDGLKTNITITNNYVHDIGGCCGIELQDGNASAVTMTGNTVERSGDSGMSAVGLNGSVGTNSMSNNTITDCGRFGIEVKNPDGSTTVDGNTVSLTTAFSTLKPSELRDIAGIAVIRRSVTAGNVDLPNGVTVTNNNVSGYIQDNGSSNSEGFGIVIEGVNHTVNGNTLTNNDIGVQFQAGHLPLPPADGDQSNLTDQYFGRGNTQNTCANTMGTNTFSGNGTDTRNVGVGAGLVQNITKSKMYCSIQAAIDDPTTTNGDHIVVSAGTYNEAVVVNKVIILEGAGNTPSGSIITNAGGTALTLMAGTNNANRVVAKKFRLTGSVTGLVTNDYNTIEDIASVSNSNYGINISGSDDLLVTNSQFNNNVTGLKLASTSSGSNWTFTNCEFNDNTSNGWYADANSSFEPTLDNVTVTNSTFNNNVNKGIYLERLSNAVFDGITVDNSGVGGAVNHRAGIDFNLKWRTDYSNIQIKNSVISNCGKGDPNGGGILIKARSDGSYASNPAQLDNVSLENLIVTGNGGTSNYAAGIIIGESHNAYTGVNTSPTNVSITECSITGNSPNQLRNALLGTSVSATCNWWGTVVANDIATNEISGTVTYSPYLINGTDDQPGTPGFQPATGTCLGSPIVINSVTTTGQTCGASDGSIEITFSGGTASYNISWTGPSNGNASNITSPHTITGLAAGAYSFTITDANSSTVTGNGTVNYLPVTNTTSNQSYATIQGAINAASAGNVIVVCDGTYLEDVTINKANLTLSGSGYATTTISGPIGGGNATVRIQAAGAIVEGFTITREGNNVADWNNPNLNIIGIAIQSQGNYGEIRNNHITGNRTGIDINHSNGNNIHNNIIDNNRTGAIFRNQTDNTDFQENFVTNNWTSGILFLDASGGSNSPLQQALSSTFNNNDISGNWYADIEDRQAGGSLPAPGTNPKNFECNWFGQAASPSVNNVNGSEPGYAALIPVVFGGTSVPPGTHPNVAGVASANFDYISWLTDGTDDQPLTIGFQPVSGACSGTPIVINSVTTTGQTCGASDGSIEVTFSGGTASYDIAWTGPSNGNASGITSPYTITGLAAGTYNFTITDANSSTVTGNGTVNYLPVTNTTQSTYHTTIQAAIDAATAGDVISLCAGTYNEEVTLNKGLTIKGAQYGVDPRPSVGSTRTIGGANESIVKAAKNKNVLKITADNVVIDGIQITQDGGSGTADAVKASATQSNITFSNNIIASSTDEGIQLEAGNDYTISKNYVYNPKGDGITLSSYDVMPVKGSNQKILNNEIEGSESAYGSIYLYGTKEVEIAGNKITTKSSGIAIGSGGLPVSNTHVHHNDINTELRTAYSALAAGIAIDDKGDDIVIENNSIVQFGGYVPPANFDRYNLIRVGVDGSSNPTNVQIHDNYLSRTAAQYYLYVIASVTNTVDATCNWFSTNVAGDVASRVVAAGSVNYLPYLNDGTDTDGGAVGFVPTMGACTGCPGGLLVTNTNTGKTFCSIQAAIDDVTTLSGHVILVSAGTFTEDVLITKSLTLKGANAGIACGDGARGAETIIQPATSGQTPIRLSGYGISDNVTIDGFEITGPGSNYGIYAGADGASGLTIINNNIHDIGTLRGSGNVHGINFRVNNPSPSNITIEDNCITDVLNDTNIALGNSAGIWVGQSTANGIVTNLSIKRNKINNIKSYASGKSSAGITIEAAWGAGTGGVQASEIEYNDITNIIGINSNAFAINLAGKTPDGATVKNNYVNSVTSTAGTAVGVAVASTNTGTADIKVNENSFTNMTVAIGNATGISFDAECNWYGFTDHASVAGKILGVVDYISWLVSGTDNNGLTYGFVPGALACSGTPIVINLVTTTSQTCGVSNGSIEVTFSGGTAPYGISWTGPSNGNASGITSPYTISSLAAGTYSFTITDANSSTVTGNGTVNLLPVTNITQSTYHATIQAAIDAATAGDVIEICSGTYTENAIVNKSLTIDGAGSTCGGVVIEGGGSLAYGFRIPAGVEDVTIQDVTIQNTVGTGGGIDAYYGNNGLVLQRLCLINTSGLGAIKLQGPVDNVTIDNCEVSGSGVNGRGIVIWDGLKTNITITNNYVHDIGGCCGIELQDGNASAVTMTGNTVERSGDSGMSAVGLNGSVGTNSMSNNTITDCGRFGIEVKNPDGSTTVDGNTVSLTTAFSTLKPSELRDIAGIAVIRRSVTAGNVDLPNGVTVTNNNVSGYIQDNGSSNSEGFGIVIEGVNHTVNGNTLTNNDIGVQFQAGHLPLPPADGDQSNLADQYFGRGNTQNTCANTMGTNTFSGNGTNTRNVGVGAGLVTNLNTNKMFCSIQAAINDATTLSGHVISVSAGTYAENIVVTKELSILGPNAVVDACTGTRVPEAIIVPATDSIKTGRIFNVLASNVTISGLTIDGDNPSLTSGYLGTTGADLNAAEGVSVYVNNVNNLTITNNIFKNLSYFGVFLYGANGSAPATTGHTISNNKFSNLGTYDVGSGKANWGGGVLIYNNHYSYIHDNCMNDVRTGIQTGNFHRANPGGSNFQLIENNTIEARRRGIFHNLFYSSASPFTVRDNAITGLDNSNETLWDGILVSSQANAVQIVKDNTIDGTGLSPTKTTIGINVWNDQVAPEIDGGNISNVKLGINVNNYEGYNDSNAGNTVAVIKNVTVTTTTIAGIKVHDNPSNTNVGAIVNANIGTGNTISNSPIGVWVVGPDATATITHNNFTSNTTDIQSDATAGSVVANYNNLSGSSYGIKNLSSNTLDGRHNYWNEGDDSGPGTVGSGTGVHVSTNVEFCPWLDDAAPGGVDVNAAGGSIAVTDASGNTMNDGIVCSGEEIKLEVINAQAGSTYLWSTSETTAEITLHPTSSTTYSVTVSYGGCQTVLSYNVTVNPNPTINVLQHVNVDCYGNDNGLLEVEGASGSAPYSYNWSNMANTALIDNLAPGTYTVTVTDANGCEANDSYTITQPAAPLTINSFTVSNESAINAADGSITVNASGGTPPYMYSKDGGLTWQVSSTFGGLSFGTYPMMVKDANGCTDGPQDVTVTVNGQLPDLTVTRFAASYDFFDGNTVNEVIRIRNRGAGPTYAPIEFTISEPDLSTNMSILENLNPSVTILGVPYTLGNANFTVDKTSIPGFWKYTSINTFELLPGDYVDIGLDHSRSGGIYGYYNSIVTITTGTGGGDTVNGNNIAILRMIKL